MIKYQLLFALILTINNAFVEMVGKVLEIVSVYFLNMLTQN